jgi:hypothetical protein
MVWAAPDTSLEYREGELITLPPPLPQQRIAVSDIFSALP